MRAPDIGVLERAVADVLARRDRMRHLRFVDASARITVTNLQEIVIDSLHTGILGMDVQERRGAILPSDTQPLTRAAVSTTFDRIETTIIGYTDSPHIGQIARTLDPVLATMLTHDRSRAIDLINRARITVLDDSDEYEMEEVLREQVETAADAPHAEHMTAAITLTGTCTWRSDLRAVHVDHHVPQSLRTALTGRDLTDLLTHPYIPPGITITGIEDGDGIENTLVVNIAYEPVRLKDVLSIDDLPTPPKWLDGTPIDFERL